MKRVRPRTNVETGEFPYPITGGPEESRYLTWVRNHSNYMAERGFLDYFRMIAVLVRGILINFLTLLPYLLLVSLMLSVFYKTLLNDWKSQVDADGNDEIELFLTRNATQSGWFRSLQDLLYVVKNEASVLGTWNPGETLTTRLTSEDGSTILSIVTTVVDGATSVEEVRDAHLSNLAEATRLAAEIKWTPSGTDWIATTAPASSVATMYASEQGAFGYVESALTVAGTWSAGDTLSTTLTDERGWTMSVITTLETDAKTVAEVRDRHLADLVAARLPLAKIDWTPKDEAKIDASGEGFFLSAADSAASGAFAIPQTPTPFLLTPVVVALAGVWILLFPIYSRLSKVLGYKKTLETGRTSSIKIRDLVERSYGGFFFVIVAVIVVESLPLLVHYFHQLREAGLAWLSYPTAAGAISAIVAANKFLPLLGGMLKKLAMILVGALGLLIPLIVILLAVEFLVYAPPYDGVLIGALFLLPLLIGGGIILALVFGMGSLKGRGIGRLFMLFAVTIGLFTAVIVLFLSVGDGAKNFAYLLAWTVEIWLFCWLTIDVNLTSINGLYRDRLASAFLVGVDTRGDVDIEEDVDLQEICQYQTGSTAPYHLVNVAHNLQGSKDIAIRERNSDFFIFSKRFIGGDRTGYCRSEHMEQVYPQVDLGTAMAISAAAASPNMGRNTNPLFVAFMTLLNVRLGYWVPHPGRLEERLEGGRKRFAEHVVPAELDEIARRREQAYHAKKEDRTLVDMDKTTTDNDLVGIGFSGGGIRSATINLGIAQALQTRGVFDHIDYMSTVSGGGYLGSSISTLMRYRTNPVSEIAGTVSVEKGGGDEKIVVVTRPDTEVCEREYRIAPGAEIDVTEGEWIKRGRRLVKNRDAGHRSEIDGEVSIAPSDDGGSVVRVVDKDRRYRYAKDAVLAWEPTEPPARVEAGQRLLERRTGAMSSHSSLWSRFEWRIRPGALLREMLSMVDEDHKWVNVSDGGHIENLAGIELLRRRCKFVILGDGEADPNLWFNGLAALIRFARIDLGIAIEIDVDAIRLDNSQDAVGKGTENLSRRHWALGTITYPADAENGLEEQTGYLLYLKSSFTDDEDEVICEYRHRNPAFPHESTADQFFDEGQFEAYRALGEHIGKMALEHVPTPYREHPGAMTFEGLRAWFTTLEEETDAPLHQQDDDS